MSDFRRVHCVYHTDEFITNFCKEKNCLMPLCPSCIGGHNQYHIEKGIKANYLNIFDSLAEVQTLMYGCLVNLEDDKKRNEDVLYSIHSLPGIVHQKVLQTKNLVYSVIQAGFEELERQIVNSMERRHEQSGVYSLKLTEKVQADVLVGIGELLQMIEQLKTDKCLSSMIKFYSDSEGELSALHHKTTSFLHTNQHYHPSVEINQDALSNFKAVISKLIHVKFTTTQPANEYGTLSRVSRLKRPTNPNPTTFPRTPPKVIRSTGPGISVSRMSPSPYTKTFVEGGHHSPQRSRVVVPPLGVSSVIGEDYDEQFKELSRKVKEMRRQNQMLSQALRRF